MSRRRAREAVKLIDECYAALVPLLSGRGPDMQGAVMLDLTARWLAGFHDTESAAGSDELRKRHLAQFADAVLKMAKVYAEQHNVGQTMH